MTKSISANNKPLLCIAHRGGRALGTENTLATIDKALALNVDAIEIDVWRVGEQLLVTHDRELGRVIRGSGRILDLSATQVAQLRHHDDSPVATLQEVVDLVGNRARLNVEIKGPDCVGPIAQLLNLAIDKKGFDREQFIVSSFDHQQLYWLQHNAPQLLRGCLTYGLPHDGIECCKALSAYSYHPSVDFIDPELIAKARDLGMEVWAYTVNNPADFAELADLGATGVFTDDPVVLQDYNRQCVLS